MKVLFVASEANPFVKTGGLGEVIGGLANGLKKRGTDVRVVIPKYSSIRDEYTRKFQFVKWFIVNVGWRKQYCGVFKYIYKGVQYYFIDNEYYFYRDRLYGEYDDAERFAFFDRAIFNLMKEVDWKPDIIHCNDWQTGMIPVLYKAEYENDNFYQNIKMIFSIHNLYFQGIFNPGILPELFGYDYSLFLDGSIKMDNGISFLKAGINYSDKILTVSKTYANEIRTQQYGEGLEEILEYRKSDLIGILNGIDYEEYNPESDKYIFINYSIDEIQKKYENKEELQKQLLLTVNREIPMLAMVSRLTHQKGYDLVISILDRLLQKDVQVVILGNGDPFYEEVLKKFEYRYHDKISVSIMFNDNLAHRIYAAADIILVPSLFEPCGLAQLIGLRYGSLPIARETGGLKDTIFPYDKNNGIGNGFTFKNYNVSELMRTTEYALDLYKNKESWNSLIIQAMKSDNSWERISCEYEDVYIDIISN